MHGKKHGRRYLAAALASLLVAASLPTAAFADAGTGIALGSYAVQAGEQSLYGGTVTYDADTRTLTLNGVAVTGNVTGVSIASQVTQEVTVALEGVNTFGSQSQPVDVGMISEVAPLRIVSAEGSSLEAYTNFSTIVAFKGVSIEGGELNLHSGSTHNAIYSDEAYISLQNVSLDAHSGYAALFAQGALSLSGSTVKVETDDWGIHAGGDLTISDTDLEVQSTYAAIHAGGDITVGDGAQVRPTSNDAAILAGGGLLIRGADTVVNAKAGTVGLWGTSDLTIQGATVTVHSADDVALYCQYGPLALEGGTLTATADAKTALYAETGIEIADSKLTVDAPKGNSVHTPGDLAISGAQTDALLRSAFPLNADGDLTISGGQRVESRTTDGTAIAAQNILISGGNVTAHTTSGENGTTAMTALYAMGDITIQGKTTTVNASAAHESGIFAREGTISLLAAGITATGGDGEPGIVARQNGASASDTQQPNLIVGPDFLAGNNIVATTVWKLASDNTTWYADTLFVPQGTALPIQDYSAAVSQVTVTYAPADYAAVDTALDQVPADLTPYTQITAQALEAACAAVARGKDVSEQSQVDAMAQAIEQALAALAYRGADYTAVDAALSGVPDDLSPFTPATVQALRDACDAVVRGKNITEQGQVNNMAAAIEESVAALAYRDADYSAVDAALARVPADLSGYTQESVAALQAAIAGVQPGLKIGDQKRVDAMAKAIDEAVGGLKSASVAGAETPAGPGGSNPPQEPGADTPQTGAFAPAPLWTLAVWTAGSICAITLLRRKKGC